MATPITIKRHPAISSNIVSAGYDPASKTLEIVFKNGAIYRYTGVPKETYEGMWKAESMGRFVAANIATKFKYQHVNKKKTV